MSRKPINTELFRNYCNEHLELAPELPSGLRWKKYPDRMKGRYGNKDGTMAGFLKPNRPYYLITIRGIKVFTHRVVWMMHYNEEPPEIIDHIRGVEKGNGIENLRGVTHIENLQNWTAKGYTKAHKGNGYMARLRVDGKDMYLGTFSTPEKAREVYLAAKREYHPSFAS